MLQFKSDKAVHHAMQQRSNPNAVKKPPKAALTALFPDPVPTPPPLME